MTPRSLAEGLTSYFLQNGNFFAAGGILSGSAIPSATLSAIHRDGAGFSGLAVQAVGHTVTDGVDESQLDEQDRPGVHIYVARGSKKYLEDLPGEVGGIPCTVHNIGKLVVKPNQSAFTTNRGQLYERRKRIACGSSCAPSGRQYAGTLGALVRKKGSPKTVYALSNNHVFADCNHTAVGQPILSPSGTDGRPGIRAPREICRHSEMVELRSGEPSLVAPCREDVAIAEITDADLVSSWQGDEQQGYDTPTAIAEPKTGLKVKKFGRTTGLTSGTMQSEQVRTDIPYEAQFFRALVWFQGVWVIRSNDGEPFALGGDSGSLVVTEDHKAAVGLIFAASMKDGTALVVPFQRIAGLFGGLGLVNKHNV